MSQNLSNDETGIRPEAGLSISEARREFFRVAAEAVRDGLITQKEVDVIYRPGSRKQVYFSRHLYDLNWLIRDRRLERQEKADGNS